MRRIGLAVAWVGVLLAQQPDPELGLRDAVRRNPSAFEANHDLGEYLIRRGRLAEAIPYLAAAYRANPSYAGNGYDLGLAYLETGALDKARSHVREMLARADAADLHNLLGAVEDRAGDMVTAAKEFQRAAEMDPSEKNLFDLGDHLLRYRGYDDALKIFRYGINKYRRSPRLRVGLGIAQYSLGNYDEAVESLCAAFDLDPADSRPLYFLGEMHDISPKLAGEVTWRLAALAERYPRNAQANYYYAVSLWKRKPDQAGASKVESLLKQALALDARFAAAQFQLAVLYEDTGRTPEAIGAYQRALRIDPNHEKAHYRLGQLYARAGQRALAERHLAAYRRLHESSQRAIAAPDARP